MSAYTYPEKETKQLQSDVAALFQAMSQEFRSDLMGSLILSKDRLKLFLETKDVQLQGDLLLEVHSHLESLLSRIEASASEKSKFLFPTYDEWVDKEYKEYKAEHQQADEEIERLMGEGGAVDAPVDSIPVVNMVNDSEAHYNQQKSDFEKTQNRSNEAIKLMKIESYRVLAQQLDKMGKVIVKEIQNH